MYPFERFTEPAKRVLTLAQEEAERLGQTYIGTEHILIGLIRQEQGMAARVLRDLGVELAEVRKKMESVLGRSPGPVRQGMLPTSRVKRVIELSFQEAHRRSSASVGTEHLLLGLLLEGEGIAAQVLQDFGVQLARVEAVLEALISRDVPPEEVAAAQEAFFIWLKVGSRVLYHDPEPPYRLWEGRVVEHDTVGDPPTLNVRVAIEAHPTTTEVVVPAGQLHRIPLASTAGCPRCQHGQPP